MRLVQSGWLLALLLVAVPVRADDAVTPFVSRDDLAHIRDEEQRVWDEAAEFDDLIRKADVLYADKALEDYLNRVALGLYPEFAGRISIRVLKSPFLNAFALPNGSIYINQGLVARFQNEAQLATVLAHEITHFTHRHSLRSQRNLKNTGLFRLVANLLGLPWAVDLLAVSSIYGYSRELETEADAQGFKRVADAGYDLRETPKVFQHLMEEIQAADIKEPFFFSSHPKLQERLDNYRKFAEGAPPEGGRFEHEYVERTTPARIANLENELSMGRYKHVLLALCNPDRMQNYPPHVHYYLGEAYRLRNAQGDDISAEQSYLRAIEDAPDFAPSYRALGTLYLKAHAYDEAAMHLSEYLSKAPRAADRQYAELYLRLAQRRGQPQ